MALIFINSIVEFSKKSDDDMLDFYIARIANSDKDALAELYHKTSGSVYGFALSILKNVYDAEDILQDTYLKRYSSAKSYKSMKKPLAWILTITRNLCLMKLRDSKKTVGPLDEDWNASFAKFPMVTAEDRVVLTACMEKLSEEERQIIILYLVSGFKHREIAEIFSLPLSTVLSKYNRAIKKLRNYLTEGESR